MNKIVFSIIGLVIVALAGGAFFAGGDEDSAESRDSMTVAVDSTPVDDTSGDEQSEITLQSSGANSIQPYSVSALAESETENNLLFFHAQWCTVCKSVERNIEAGSIPDDLSIFLVDFDSNEGQDLADKYRIPIQYSMVQVDNDGTEVNQWVNNFGDGIDDITSNLL